MTINSHGNALPAAVLIGIDGILPPTQAIEDDGLTVYDPQHDGLDFYKSLEGMLVTVEQPLVVSNTTSFGETYVVASGGAGATGSTRRGGITLSPGDYNPERIQIDNLRAQSQLRPRPQPGRHSVRRHRHHVLQLQQLRTAGHRRCDDDQRRHPRAGDDQPRRRPRPPHHRQLQCRESRPRRRRRRSSTCSPRNIVYNLAAPDIIGLQEVQDADGPGNGSNLSGRRHRPGADRRDRRDWRAPLRLYRDRADTAGSTGGEPGGNIR